MASATQGFVLAIDQGTTGSTALVIDHEMKVHGRANTEFQQLYPKPGWVEHAPTAIWASVEASVKAALEDAAVTGADIVAIGITNQRETSLVWERATGQAIHNAIVWQCRRTTEMCQALKAAGHEALVRDKTGLVLDPYFSGTKVAWTLDHVEGSRERAAAGELAFGTIDTFLLWKLSGGEVHATEVSNASRTMLMALDTCAWDDALLEALRVPREILPEIRSSSEVYGTTKGVGFLPDGVPIAGIAGDQQAALFGQACFSVGEAKSTYGTGAFVLLNTGSELVRSDNGLLTTVAWRLGEGETVYALEGSVFIAGAAVQWLRDQINLIDSAADVEALARQVPDTAGVIVVPAFAGLGAPYWDPEARGAIFGLTRGAGAAHLARATLEGIAQQVADVVEAMIDDAKCDLSGLRVDGGAAANDLLMQLQANLLGSPVTRPTMLETTALGAAFLAGLATGYWDDPGDIRERWRADRRFAPSLAESDRAAQRQAWKKAVARLR